MKLLRSFSRLKSLVFFKLFLIVAHHGPHCEANNSQDDTSRSYTIGRQAETSSKQTETSGEQTETSGEQTETSGGQTETSGGQTETSGGQTETSGRQTETSSRHIETSGRQTETSGGQTETSGGQTETSGYRYNIYVKSEDSLGLCGIQAYFVHKQVAIQIASNWNLFKTCLNIIVTSLSFCCFKGLFGLMP